MTETPAKKQRVSKSAIVKVRVSPAEREAIQDKAERAGLTLSEYARRSCLTGKAPIIKTPDASNAEALRLLLIAGNNLNQIARRMNAGQGSSSVALNETLSELQAAVRKVSGS